MFVKAATALSAALIATGLLATAASAHPKLVASTPAADAVVASPAGVELTFSEKLVPQFSAAALVMTGMPGMASHAPMKVVTKSAVSADGMKLVATPAKPLPAGTYRLEYKVVSADTHKIEGGYSFKVK